jgi:hypothetical protein
MEAVLRLFIRPVVTLSLLCCLLLALPLLAGKLMPLPNHDSLLTNNPCALPCVFGVIPRITTRDDALKAFEHIALRTTALEALPAYTERGSAGTQSLLALLDLSDTEDWIVRSVLLYQMDEGGDLGVLSDFLLAGYQPTRVFSACASTDRLIIILDEAGLFVQVTLSARVDPNAAVWMFGTTGGSDGLVRSLDTFGCAVQTEWSGLAALWRHTAIS